MRWRTGGYIIMFLEVHGMPNIVIQNGKTRKFLEEHGSRLKFPPISPSKSVRSLKNYMYLKEETSANVPITKTQLRFSSKIDLSEGGA